MGSLGNPAQALGKFFGVTPSVGGRDPSAHGVVAALELEPGSVVVEIGAGAGHYTIPIARTLERLGGDGLVFGVDVARSLLEQLDRAAEDSGLDLRLRTMPINGIERESLPIRDGSVDRVLSVNALHYLDDPLPGYMEVARILKPGAFALFVDWRTPDPRLPPAAPARAVSITSVAIDVLATGLLVPSAVVLPGYAFTVRAVRRSSQPILG